uniref:Uncharacterized protein n=1 Tax=Rhizophora mucronata TaxID=61149 RepID=A0A2P2PGF5_RHIMU
MGGFWLLGFG